MSVQKSSFLIVGAGRISYSLANGLVSAGVDKIAYYSRTQSSSLKLKEAVNFGDVEVSLENGITKADIVIIAIPDKDLPQFVQLIFDSVSDLSNKLFFHLSGTVSSSVLTPLNLKGAITGGLHLLQTFPERKIFNINNCFGAIEAESEKSKQLLEEIAKLLNLRFFEIKAEDKISYHLAAVFLSNFYPALLSVADAEFSKSHISKYSFAEIFTPIANRTLENSFASGAYESISGPIKRGDITTIEEHMTHLTNEKDIYTLLLYISASLKLLDIMRKRFDSDDNVIVENLLKEKLKEVTKLLS